VTLGLHSRAGRAAACTATLIFAVFSETARAAAPPELRDPEPPALPRAPEHLRAPIELVPKVVVVLPLCGTGPDTDRCGALGPAFGSELAALYRPTPYFAFGATFGYARAAGSLGANSLLGERIELSVTGRVYLLETGSLDPYLEGFVGWLGERTSLARPGAVGDEDSASGPFGRAGGGIDWFVTSSLKLGVVGGYSELIFASGRRCRAGQCTSGGAPASTPGGAVTLGIGVSMLMGEAL
jgi:hypothetical protein